MAYWLFIDYSLNIRYNQWLIIWLPVDYLLIMITHLFHWCHPLVKSGNFYFHFPLSYKKNFPFDKTYQWGVFFLLISPCVKKKCPIFFLNFSLSLLPFARLLPWLISVISVENNKHSRKSLPLHPTFGLAGWLCDEK